MNTSMLEHFKEGWDEELSKLTPEQQDYVNGLRPHHVSITAMRNSLKRLGNFAERQ